MIQSAHLFSVRITIFIPFPCVFMRNFGMCFRISMICKIYIFFCASIPIIPTPCDDSAFFIYTVYR